MTLKITAAFAAAFLANAALADGHATGDAAKGEKDFRNCKSCHMIQDHEGNNIVKGGKAGPNLYGLVGRQAGTVEGFRYGKSLVQAGEAGLVWDETEFVVYVKDPKAYLQTYLDDSKAKSKMSFKLKKGGENIWAYLVSVSPDIDTDAAGEADVTN